MENEASFNKLDLKLSPERIIELAPNRVSFSDTPPEFCVWLEFMDLIGFLVLFVDVEQRWCDVF